MTFDFQYAIEQQRKQNLLAAMTEAQNVQEGLFGRGMKGVEGYTSLQKMPADLLTMGGNIGTGQQAGNLAASAAGGRAAETRIGANVALGQGALSAFGDWWGNRPPSSMGTLGVGTPSYNAAQQAFPSAAFGGG